MVAIGMILALLSSCYGYEQFTESNDERDESIEDRVEKSAYLTEDDFTVIYDHRYIHGEESLSGLERSLIGLDDPTPSPHPTTAEARADEFMRCLGLDL